MIKLARLVVVVSLGSPPTTEASFDVYTIETNAVLMWARAIGDVNGDGLADVLFQDSNGYGGSLGWFEARDGGRSWVRRTIALVAPNGQPFAAGALDAADVDRDGDVDVLGMSHPGEWKQADARTELFWYENPRPNADPATATWRAHYIGHAPAFVKDVRFADFDRDGRLDLAAITYRGNKLLVWRQEDASRWSVVQSMTIPNLHEGMDVGDLDGDGFPDVAANGYWVRCPGASLTSSWAVGSIDAKWHNQTGDWSRNATKVLCCDLDRDGRDEVFVSHSERTGYPVSWYRADSPQMATWIEHGIVSNRTAVHTLQVADFNRDGSMDVLLGTNPGRAKNLGEKEFPVSIFLGSPGYQRWEEIRLTNDGIYNGQVADVNGDGWPDIIRLRSHEPSRLEVWLNRGHWPSAQRQP
jgi:hypothetical protein